MPISPHGRCTALLRPIRRAGRRLGFGLLWAALLLAWGAGIGPAGAGTPTIAVVVSSNLKPYLEAVQGFQARMAFDEAGKPVVHYLDPQNDPAHTLLTSKLHSEAPDLLAAVGPEAMAFLWAAFPDPAPPKLFSMVLHPERVVPGERAPCGVSLNIPVATQLRAFSNALPGLRRIGLIFDPAHNSAYAGSAVAAAADPAIDLVPLPVAGREEIPRVLARTWGAIDALWVIPDATVISESLIHFILKGAIANNVAVLGYNRFFIDSGAALALVCDYEAIGRQAAALALDLLAGWPCAPVVPAHEVVTNPRVLRALNLVPAAQPPPTAPEARP